MEKHPLARWIRAFRKLKGLTQEELARRMGVSLALLGAIERGARSVDPKTLARIAEVLNVDLAELTGSKPEGG